jgi:3-deoxy-D-manno-octulosonic-acid transferase
VIVRALYSGVLYLLMPLALARLAWRGLANPGYWARIGERFGFGPPVSPSGDRGQTFWVHAVSVGEVQAALPLMRRLLAEFPRTRLVVTTMTPTGMERVRTVLGAAVIHRYAPYDLPGAARRFLRRVDPQLAVIVETEIWPNLIHACAEGAIPVVLANVRLSERSAAGYRRVRPLLRRTLGEVNAIAAQSEDDARRLIDIGAPPAIVTVTGNTKFDVAIGPSVVEAGQVLRRTWGVDRSVWIAASTHEGEEEIVLEAFDAVRAQVPDCLLVLVPRHPERFTRAAGLARRRGHAVGLRSERGGGRADVFVGDTMGELPVFYAASDVAFVGGSLVDVGGHNMLEPAALGLPVILGPHLRNFAEIGQSLCDAEAASIVHDAVELAGCVVRHLRDANHRHGSGER